MLQKMCVTKLGNRNSKIPLKILLETKDDKNTELKNAIFLFRCQFPLQF